MPIYSWKHKKQQTPGSNQREKLDNIIRMQYDRIVLESDRLTLKQFGLIINIT